VLDVIVDAGVFPACTAILNELGVPGNVAPAPMLPLSPDQKARLLTNPLVKDAIEKERSAK
jgi:hypothetical protein